MKNFTLIFLITFLSIHPALAKDKVKKDSVKSAGDKVTLVCTFQSATKRIKGVDWEILGETNTYQICKGCKYNDRVWEISPATYSWNSKWREEKDSDGQAYGYSFNKIIIDRYSGNLVVAVTFHSQQDENSELIDQLRTTGTCKKMDAPVL